MKYIFITFSGLGFPIAYKLAQEGQEVFVGVIADIEEYVMEEEIAKAHEGEEDKKKRLALYKNMLPLQDANKLVEWMKKIPDPHEYFVFFDENNLYRWADKIRDAGFEGNFPTKEDYLFEVDREMAKQFVKKHYPKLYTPEVKEFARAAEAVEFLKTSNDFWVLKGKHDSAKTLVPDVNDTELAKGQIIEMLQNFPEKYERLGFILEQYIPSIIELTPEKLYYDGVPLATTVGIENKSFGSGNISVQTGCAEDMVFPIDMEDRINKIAFPEIVDQMAREHKGLFIWDASLLINKKDGKIYFGEFCSNRPGYNSIFTEIAQCQSVHYFFENLVHKKSPFTLGTVAVSVRIFNMNTDPETHQISDNITVDFKDEIEKNLWLWDTRKNSNNSIVTVGYDWSLAVITGDGKSVNEAVGKLYRNLDGFAFVGAYYRARDDYLSLEYATSVLNRVNYGLERGLYKLPFDVKVGEIR